MKSKKSSKLITIVLSFAVLIFSLGSFFFFKFHNDNKNLKEELLTVGIKSTGHILDLSKEVTRKRGQLNYRWQFLTDYVVEYWYMHNGEAQTKGISLADYLDDGNKKKEVGKKMEDLGKVETQNSISKAMFKRLESEKKVDIVYLLGKPNSAKTLTPAGDIEIPPLGKMGYLCLFLLLSSIGMLVYYLQTGKTF